MCKVVAAVTRTHSPHQRQRYSRQRESLTHGSRQPEPGTKGLGPPPSPPSSPQTAQRGQGRQSTQQFSNSTEARVTIPPSSPQTATACPSYQLELVRTSESLGQCQLQHGSLSTMTQDSSSSVSPGPTAHSRAPSPVGEAAKRCFSAPEEAACRWSEACRCWAFSMHGS